MSDDIYSVTCSEWKLVQLRLDDLENLVSDLKLKLGNCKCNSSTHLETGHSDDDETGTVIGHNGQTNTSTCTSAVSEIIQRAGQSTTQSEETVTLAVTVSDESNVVDSTLTASTSSSLNNGSSTEVPDSTYSTLRLSNGMEILEIEKYRRAQVKITRCDEVVVTRTLSLSGNVNNNSAPTCANNGSHSSSKKRPALRRKGNGARNEQVSALPLSHEKRFVCHFCSKGFVGNSLLTRHIRVHTGEKPFQCNICSMRFNQRSTVKMHIRVHTGDKPFECEFCCKKFRFKSGLNFHLRCHTGERPFVCHFCSKRFNRSESLATHTRSHTGERPYTCQFCSKAFAAHSNLTLHMKVHTREKPYSCTFCPKVFAHSQSLKRHLIRHPGENPQSQSQIQHEDVPGS